jgi:phosphotransferase system, enzyme I, PtsP
MIQFNQPQIIIEGVSLNLGIAHGQAYMYDPEDVEDNFLTVAEKEKNFLEAIKKAVELCGVNLQFWQERNRELVLVQKALLQDSAWQQRVVAKICFGMSISEALTQVLDDLNIAFGSEGFWAARFQEIKGVTQLVRQCLTEKEVVFDKIKPTILCAKTISPVEMMQFDQANLVGLVVEDNSFLSHGMIIARSRKIPVVGGVIELKKFINNNDQLLIDGDLGRIYVRPQSAVLANYDSNKKVPLANPIVKLASKTDKIAVISRDGIAVNLLINANISEDLDCLERSTIKGVGLYRTEIPFMMSERWPDVETQTRLYLQVMNKAKEKFVIFRALDVGGDKTFQSIHKNFKETQKGWRHSRFTMQRPSLIRLQLRAMIRARSYCDYPDLPLHVMFPMITEAQEMRFVRALMQKELDRENGLGHKIPKTIKIGAMVEVPSIVFQLNQFLDLVDFISIGSNDLFQFFFAIDRADAVMSRRYDILSRSFMQMLKTIVDQAKSKGIPVSLCGEMASRPLEAMALLGIGLRHFSINPGSVETMENMIQSLDVWSVQDCMNDCLSDSPSANKTAHLSIRQRILELAQIQQTLLS